MNIHDEFDTNKKGSSIIRSMNGHKKDITAAAFSESLSLIACGTADGWVWVWDFDKCGLEAKLDHEGKELTCLVFMFPHPVLCSADVSGKIQLIMVKPAPNKNQKVLRFENVVDGNPSTVQSMAWSREDKTLVTGDERGTIGLWTFSKFFEKNEISQVRTRANTVKGIKYGDIGRPDVRSYRGNTMQWISFMNSTHRATCIAKSASSEAVECSLSHHQQPSAHR